MEKGTPGRKPSHLKKAIRSKMNEMDDLLREWERVRFIINPNAERTVYEEDYFDDMPDDTDAG